MECIFGEKKKKCSKCKYLIFVYLLHIILVVIFLFNKARFYCQYRYLLQEKKKKRSHETDIKYALGFGDRYIFIRLGEYEFLHQKELHSSCLPCSSFLVCYCKRVKTITFKAEGVFLATSHSEMLVLISLCLATLCYVFSSLQ